MLKHKDWGSPIVIGVRISELYRLQIDTPKALVNSSILRDQGELWNRRMDYIHQGALRMIHELVISVLEVSIEHDDVCR